MPIGSTVGRKTDARFIAATHQDLSRLVESGEFRHDLYHRLNVLFIMVPPLRDRVSDLELLVQYLLSRAVEDCAIPEMPRLLPAARERLHRHTWPGNVRELENCVLRAALSARGGVIRAGDILFGVSRRVLEGSVGHRRPADAYAPTNQASSDGRPRPAESPGSELSPATRRRRELERCEAVFIAAGQSVSKAARIQGLNRTTIWRRLQALRRLRELEDRDQRPDGRDGT
jgi:DNA-binding NtrC family response regulator